MGSAPDRFEPTTVSDCEPTASLAHAHYTDQKSEPVDRALLLEVLAGLLQLLAQQSHATAPDDPQAHAE